MKIKPPRVHLTMKDLAFQRFHFVSRRKFFRFALGAGACVIAGGDAMADAVIKKPVPKTGELLPVIGLGTWQVFDVGASEAARKPLSEVLREFIRLGGSVIDSSPMYGRSESVVGDLTAELDLHKQLFIATKVWTSGRESAMRQIEESFKLLRIERLDLLQVHNLLDYHSHLATLRRLKEQGKIRYIGVTHYTASAYDELARVLATEELDFVQLNYSLAERDAERRLLPLAAEKRIAVLANRPFAGGALFRRVRSQPLPAWAEEIGCASWSQLFLKFAISHPTVTCAIPATGKVQHLIENMQAGLGSLPAPAMRKRMADHFAAL